MCARPAAFNWLAVFGPTPGQPFVGQRRQEARFAGRAGTNSKAAGFLSLEAIWLTSLLLPMPSLTGQLERLPDGVANGFGDAQGAGLRAPVRSK